jgi:hypothetical protein
MYELKFVWRHSTLIIPSPTERRQSVAASVQKIPDSVVKLAELAIDRVNVSSETIRLSISLELAVNVFLHVTYLKYKQMLVFNLIFELLWTGRGFWVSSVAFLRFRELKYVDRHGCKRINKQLRGVYAFCVLFVGLYDWSTCLDQMRVKSTVNL